MSRLVEVNKMSAEQYNVLRILRGAGSDGLPTLEVADRLVEHTPAITRLLDKLEKRGFVRRERPPQDRRRVMCFITKAGLSLLRELDPLIEREQKASLDAASEQELRQLIRILDKIRAEKSEVARR
jgi:DNA-binding MarR family transcriptional regulator